MLDPLRCRVSELICNWITLLGVLKKKKKKKKGFWDETWQIMDDCPVYLEMFLQQIYFEKFFK